MITENRCSFLFIILLLTFLVETSHAETNSHICTPSACGNIRNISFPFRLKLDPKRCGNPLFELECENNVTTILKLNSQKYRVKEINYANRTIWVADASVNNNTCSLPKVSLNMILGNSFRSPYHTERITYTAPRSGYFVVLAWPIIFMSCPYPFTNSSIFLTELPTRCNSNSNSNSSRHTYIKVGGLRASDVREMCTVDPIVFTSWEFKGLEINYTVLSTWRYYGLENVSYSEIHHSLVYGFRLSWMEPYCRDCNGRLTCAEDYYMEMPTCRVTLWDYIKHPIHGPDGSGPLSAVVIILLLSLGVSLPAKIILGTICASGFVFIEMKQEIYLLNMYWPRNHLRLIFGIFLAVRFIIASPYMVWFLINKFRKRHLSRYDAIENYLQSDNHFMPLRYSYSDIKKMTSGFQEKLGQGGYGSVYKGKLRSGYDVAVKLLKKKPGEYGQDFMNEIATIGRIHHVNVVNLVGYCAERSKRALIFDFMPNGSLDKYILGSEKNNCLSWERKYEIALGVARGIEYLHKGCNIQILHFDIKPHNILLDDNFTPKITDFGLAKFFSKDKNEVTMTALRGTIGYLAPEFNNRGLGGVSYKADVYSFGMLLMDMVGLNRNINRGNEESSKYFPCWIYDCFKRGQDIDYGITDENNDGDDNDTNKIITKKMTIVALWCIQWSPGDRPSMNKVLEMLEAPLERLQVPNRSSQSSPVNDHSWTSHLSESTTLLGHDAAPSIEMTIVNV